MAEAFICDYVRTPIGRFGGALSSVRTDDLAAVPIRALKDRNSGTDWDRVDEVVFGCAESTGGTPIPLQGADRQECLSSFKAFAPTPKTQHPTPRLTSR